MSRLKITGGRELKGEVRLQGAKNGVLPIMAASILSGGVTVIENCPALTDVEAALDILRHLGCRAEFVSGTVTVDSSTMTGSEIPDDLMRKMRSSVMFLGPILARCGQASISMPGGCELGPRPIDMHLAAMGSLGARIREDGGNLILTAPRLTGGRIDLATPSVGATENSMLAAAGASGTTLITNAAREPEIRDLGIFLEKMGVHVSGAGTSTVTVEGGGFRPHIRHRALPDRIAAATYISAVAAAGGEIVIRGACPDDLTCVTDAFSQMGVEISSGADVMTVTAPKLLRAPGTVVTRPYPGFPTDAQPTLMAACLRARGASVFVETIFENRYRHVPELRRMGARIRVDGRVAIVEGGTPLHGAKVEATDLRGGAALIVAALASEGTSEVSKLHHIDRGYENIAGLLRDIGADIEKID